MLGKKLVNQKKEGHLESGMQESGEKSWVQGKEVGKRDMTVVRVPYPTHGHER